MRRLPILAILMAMLLSCSETPSGTTPAPAVVRDDFFDYVVHPGEVVRFTSNTVIISDYIEIAGQIQLAPNTSLWLLSTGHLCICPTGSIVPDPAVAEHPVRRWLGGSPRAAWAQVSGSPSGGPLLVLAGVTVAVDGPVTGAKGPPNGPGGHVHLVTFRPPDDVDILGDTARITSVVTGGPGRNGDESFPSGGRGGDVTMDSDEGRTAVIDAFARSDVLRPPFARTSLLFTGFAHGGQGGNGFSDVTGRLDAGTLTCVGGNGGDGGSVYLNPSDARSAGAQVQGGNGGNGGNAGSVNTRAPDAAQAGQAGTAFQGVSGSGGSGGSGRMDDSVLQFDGHPLQLGGQPGIAGSVIGAAGQGGPGSQGGQFSATVGVRGQDGRPQLLAPQTARPVVQILPNGGRGGDAAEAAQSGGAGGAILLQLLSDSTITLAAGAAEGGDGFDGSSATPRLPGTAGGNGGLLTYRTDIRSPVTSNGAGNGGDGGDGFPTAGTGGLAGRDDRGVPYGLDGTPGVVVP
ncbi:MAG: hypothetical protein AB1758_23845 [Candidatus Eremiobacterota bacterium]